MACCIKGCNSRRDQNGSANKSFFTARTNDMFISWYNVLCTKNIKINKYSRICELHFKSEEIIKEDAFSQVDGKVIYVKRKNLKLKEGAVPSIFPKNIRYYQQIEHNNSDDVMSCEFSTECETSETISHSAEEPIPSTSHGINITLQIEDRSFVPTKETIKFSVEDMNVAKNIEVPTSYWFANINDSCMMWTCWANDLSYILRRVIIKTNMKVQVFIGDNEISFDTKMINNIQEIKQILMKLQTFFPCEEINDKDRVTNCHGFVIKSQYRVEEKIRCLACKKSWKMLLRKRHNFTLMQKLRNKNKKLQVSNLNYKFLILQIRVLKLKKQMQLKL